METNTLDRRGRTCTFTGHREAKLPWTDREADPRCLALKRCIYDAVEAVYCSGIRFYICGMASGCDLYFAEAVLLLRETHPEAELEAAVPYPGQPERWSPIQRERYRRILASCDKKTVLAPAYTRDCMMRRNRYMVDHASTLITAYNGSPGGTRNTLLYAIRQGLEIIQLPILESIESTGVEI